MKSRTTRVKISAEEKSLVSGAIKNWSTTIASFKKAQNNPKNFVNANDKSLNDPTLKPTVLEDNLPCICLQKKGSNEKRYFSIDKKKVIRIQRIDDFNKKRKKLLKKLHNQSGHTLNLQNELKISQHPQLPEQQHPVPAPVLLQPTVPARVLRSQEVGFQVSPLQSLNQDQVPQQSFQNPLQDGKDLKAILEQATLENEAQEIRSQLQRTSQLGNLHNILQIEDKLKRSREQFQMHMENLNSLSKPADQGSQQQEMPIQPNEIKIDSGFDIVPDVEDLTEQKQPVSPWIESLLIDEELESKEPHKKPRINDASEKNADFQKAFTISFLMGALKQGQLNEEQQAKFFNICNEIEYQTLTNIPEEVLSQANKRVESLALFESPFSLFSQERIPAVNKNNLTSQNIKSSLTK